MTGEPIATHRLVGVVLFVLLSVTVISSGVVAQDSAGDPIQTDYFVISYEDGNRGEAEEVATFADAYYEVLFQRFGVEPVDEKIPVRVVERGSLDCDSPDPRGCYKSGTKATIYVTSDSRSVFYHELTHRFQARAMEGGTWINPPGSIDKFDVFVEGTASYLDRPAGEIADGASFSRDEIDMTTKDATGAEYDDLALFAEFVLHEYGREGFDMLYTESDPRDVASLSEGTYPELVERFYAQLPEQEARLRDGGAPLPGFTYDPFLPEPGSEVTFDARTPGAIEQLGRSWYPGAVDAYEWDFDNDGTIDATGPTVTRTIADPASTTVTLYVTVDGTRYSATQSLLDSSMQLEESAVEPAFEVTRIERGTGLDPYYDDRTVDFEAAPGQTVELDLTVENRGLGGSQQIEVVLDGDRIGSRQLELAKSDSQELSIQQTLPSDLSAGVYDYEVRIGERTWSRQIKIAQPQISVGYGSISVDEGTPGWIENAKVKPGKRMQIDVELQAGSDSNLDGEIELYFDQTLAETRSVTFGPGSEVVSFDVAAPSEVGTYQIRAVPVVDGGVAAEGFDRRITVTKDNSIAKVDLESDAGMCPVSITSVSIFTVYKDDEGYIDAENVTAINPGDGITWNVNVMPSTECEGVLELPLDFSGDTRTVRTGVRGPLEVYFDPTYAFEEPGTHELRYKDTVLDTVTVTAETEQSSTEAPTEQSGGGETDPDDGEQPPADQSADSTPGFGLVTSLTALLILAGLMASRSQ